MVGDVKVEETPEGTVEEPPENKDIRKQKIKMNKINNKLKEQINKQSEKKEKETVKTDDADSSIQSSGWCYIGNDEGVRKCVNINEQVCMSELVYKSKEDCLNDQ